jgi:hypothetical protein
MPEAYSLIPPYVGSLDDPFSIVVDGYDGPNNHPEQLVLWAIKKTSEQLQELAPDFRERVVLMLREAWKAGYLCYIYSAHRSIPLQQELFEKYQAGKGLTAARPGESKHNFARAIDIQVLAIKGGQLAGGLKLLDDIQKRLKLNFEWGASYKDPNHFEDNNFTISDLKKSSDAYKNWAEENSVQVDDNRRDAELKNYLGQQVVTKAYQWRMKNTAWIAPVLVSTVVALVVLMAIKVKYS